MLFFVSTMRVPQTFVGAKNWELVTIKSCGTSLYLCPKHMSESEFAALPSKKDGARSLSTAASSGLSRPEHHRGHHFIRCLAL